ncbi:circadian clock protein KaiA [Myxacorys almedinensis A]|uniref:Circadian clock oscillator protein KaiA n=2 Tax=Myxacorys TaxID=2056239 RepID=A0A8J7Z3M2_9CYAN|nr:circadian clock protein KaiA [Myxacorys almedinensis A]
MFEGERFTVAQPCTNDEFFDVIDREKQQIDCLILQDGQMLPQLINWLQAQATLLPAIILDAEAQDGATTPPPNQTPATVLYHTAEIRVSLAGQTQMAEQVEAAIAAFLKLSPSCQLPNAPSTADDPEDRLTTQNFLMLQQQRLTDKLKARLGYLGVYYKRNPKDFLRHLSPRDRHTLMAQVRKDYRAIILTYFDGDAELNQRVDNFVNLMFFADVPVAQIVEIHMELMDEFSKQLKLEGRSEEILLDYRLTLIDAIAHLCEMYRRAVPRE